MPDQDALLREPVQFRLLVGILVKLTNGVQSAFAEENGNNCIYIFSYFPGRHLCNKYSLNFSNFVFLFVTIIK